MATLEQLAGEKRAILELVVGRGQSYEALADMLGLPVPRVRELAREALTELAPATARNVDADWRGQVADYVLGQQAGPEAVATRGHLKRSEPARTWVNSLLDSLDELYGDRDRPDVPEAGAGDEGGLGSRLRKSRMGAVLAPPGRSANGGATGAPAEGERDAGRPADPGSRAEPARSSGAAGEGAEDAPGGDRGPQRGRRPSGARLRPTSPARSSGGGRGLSPAARMALRRRRLALGVLGALGLVGLVALGFALFGGEDEQPASASRPAAAKAQSQGQVRVVGGVVLQPVKGAKGAASGQPAGAAAFVEREGRVQLVVQGSNLRPTGNREAYEVWFYNNRRDAISVGAQVTNREGDYQAATGAGSLPRNFQDYRYIDMSLEPVDDDESHSGNSVLRGSLKSATTGGPGQGSAGSAAGGAPPPGGAAPAPGGAVAPTQPQP